MRSEANHKFYLEHRKTLLQRVKNYNSTHKQEKKEYQKNYDALHKDEKKLKMKKWHKDHPKTRETWLLEGYRKADKCRNLSCDLTKSWIKENILNKECTYCGDTEQTGCDRIDNNKGHNKDNYHLACLECNLKRRKQSDDKFLFTKQLNIIQKDK